MIDTLRSRGAGIGIATRARGEGKERTLNKSFKFNLSTVKDQIPISFHGRALASLSPSVILIPFDVAS